MYIIRCAQSKVNHVCPRGVDKRGLNSWCSRNARSGVLLARRTRTFRKCSLGKRARHGALGVGRVRMLRAGKGSLGHSPK